MNTKGNDKQQLLDKEWSKSQGKCISWKTSEKQKFAFSSKIYKVHSISQCVLDGKMTDVT